MMMKIIRIRRKNRIGTLPEGMKKSLEKEKVIAKMVIKPPEENIKEYGRNHGYTKGRNI